MSEALDTPTITVAAFQLADLQARPADAVREMQQCASRAANVGASITVFPEGFLTGYTRESVAARDRAVDLGSQQFATILSELADCEPVLIFGLVEVRDGDLFNTAVAVERGQLVGTYRKRHPNEPCYQPGTELPVFELAGLRVGIGICADARDVEDAARLKAQSVDVVLYPLNNMLPTDVADAWRDRHTEILSERARQIDAWVLSADVIGERDDKRAYGCTAAVSPDGIVAERVAEHQAGMALARLSVRRRD